MTNQFVRVLWRQRVDVLGLRKAEARSRLCDATSDFRERLQRAKIARSTIGDSGRMEGGWGTKLTRWPAPVK